MFLVRNVVYESVSRLKIRRSKVLGEMSKVTYLVGDYFLGEESRNHKKIQLSKIAKTIFSKRFALIILDIM